MKLWGVKEVLGEREGCVYVGVRERERRRGKGLEGEEREGRREGKKWLNERRDLQFRKGG